LYVTSAKNTVTNDLSCDEEDQISVDSFDHDYLSTLWSLSPFLEDVVAHISGFVVRKLLKNKSICNVCTTFLHSENVVSKLTELKNRGNLIFPSDDVILTSQSAERIIRENSHLIFKKPNIKQFLMIQIFRSVNEKVFVQKSMTDHIMEQNIFDNHKIILINPCVHTRVPVYPPRPFFGCKSIRNQNSVINHRIVVIQLKANKCIEDCLNIVFSQNNRT